MKPTEFILMILDAEVEPIEGRTVLQKLAYFTSIKAKADMDFFAHFYGPYSHTLAAKLDDLVASDFVMEKGRRTTRNRMMYSYYLTDDGQIVGNSIRKRHPKDFVIAKRVTRKCKRLVHNNISVLSWAAKVHYILDQTEKPMTYDKAVELGRWFGWKLPEKQVDSAINLLLSLRLIKKN